MLNGNLLQIFVELPKFTGSLKDISRDTPFIEKLAYVLMEMADCKEMPQNLDDDLRERFFKAADTSKMSDKKINDYMKSIIGEYDYDTNLEDAREEGLAEGLTAERVLALSCDANQRISRSRSGSRHSFRCVA